MIWPTRFLLLMACVVGLEPGAAQDEDGKAPPAAETGEKKAGEESSKESEVEVPGPDLDLEARKARVQAIKAELQVLQGKAEKGDLEAALELANKLISYRNTAVAIPFYRQAAKGGTVEAQEKLGLLLLAGDRSTWPEGHSWLDRAAQAGSVRAVEEQARVLLHGSHGREQSVVEATRLLERARGMPGAKEAHFLLGKMAAEGIGRERDGAVAVAHLRRGVEAGSIDAMLGLVELFLSDTLVKQDLKQAETLARRAYDLGSGEGAYRMAILFEQGDEEKRDLVKSREWLEKARERSHSGAIARLGTYALQGMGEAVNAVKAYHLYRQSAARGNADAAYAVAKLYAEGSGAPADPVAATAWFRIAAEGGQARAQNEYGMCLVSGRGVAVDREAAAEWFQRACKRNLPAAFVNLGELYLLGDGVEKDDARAFNLFETAAKNGHAGAQDRLAQMCEKGLGLGGVADPVSAAYWAARAAAQDERFAPLAERTRKILQKEQLGELDRRLAAAGIKEKKPK